MKPIDRKISNYFSIGYIFLGIAFLLIGIVSLYAGNPIIGIVLIIATVLMTTTHYRLKIDKASSVFKFYIWFLGIPLGKKEKFEQIEYVFLKSNKVNQTMHVESLTSTVRQQVYDIYLKFNNRKSYHLYYSKDYKTAIEKMKFIAGEYELQSVDYLEEN